MTKTLTHTVQLQTKIKKVKRSIEALRSHHIYLPVDVIYALENFLEILQEFEGDIKEKVSKNYQERVFKSYA